MGMMTKEMRFTDEEQNELNKRQKEAKIRHEKRRRAAYRSGRRDFPMLPTECSWAYEEQFRREVRS